MHRQLGASSLIAALLAVITACQLANAPARESAGPQPSVLVRVSPIPTVRASKVTDLARLDGRLAIADGCFVVIDSTGMSWAIVWPSPGVNWDGHTLTLNATPLNVGDLVALAGGEGDISRASSAAIEWIQRPSQGCLQQDGLWFTSGSAS